MRRGLPPTAETLKLDNQVAVPLVRLEPPTAAAAVGGRRSCSAPESGKPHAAPPLPKDVALRRGYLLPSYGVARGRDRLQARLYSSRCIPPPDCRVYHGDVDT